MDEAKFLRSGKAKDIYRRPNGDLIFVFTDRVTAFDGLKKAEYAHKGAICCKLTCFWFEKLQAAGIRTHYKGYLPPNMLVAEEVNIIPVEVIARNFLYGSLWKRFTAGELDLEGLLGPGDRRVGMPLTRSFLEFTTKFERVDRPITADEILRNGWLDARELTQIKEETIRIGLLLSSYLRSKGIILADFKLEFGRGRTGEIVLADEVGTPDVCRFWDKDAYERKGEIISLDKDVFREGKGDLSVVYREVCSRILG